MPTSSFAIRQSRIWNNTFSFVILYSLFSQFLAVSKMCCCLDMGFLNFRDVRQSAIQDMLLRFLYQWFESQNDTVGCCPTWLVRSFWNSKAGGAGACIKTQLEPQRPLEDIHSASVQLRILLFHFSNQCFLSLVWTIGHYKMIQ